MARSRERRCRWCDRQMAEVHYDGHRGLARLCLVCDRASEAAGPPVVAPLRAPRLPLRPAVPPPDDATR